MEDVTRADIREALTALDSDGGKDRLSELVETFIAETYDTASFDVTMKGVDVDWENEEDTVEIDGETRPVDDPFLHLHFRYHDDDPDDPREPFMNGVPWTTLHCKDADGEWHRIDWFEPQVPDDLYAEVKGRYAPHEEHHGALEDAVEGAIREGIERNRDDEE